MMPFADYINHENVDTGFDCIDDNGVSYSEQVEAEDRKYSEKRRKQVDESRNSIFNMRTDLLQIEMDLRKMMEKKGKTTKTEEEMSESEKDLKLMQSIQNAVDNHPDNLPKEEEKKTSKKEQKTTQSLRWKDRVKREFSKNVPSDQSQNFTLSFQRGKTYFTEKRFKKSISDGMETKFDAKGEKLKAELQKRKNVEILKRELLQKKMEEAKEIERERVKTQKEAEMKAQKVKEELEMKAKMKIDAERKKQEQKEKAKQQMMMQEQQQQQQKTMMDAKKNNFKNENEKQKKKTKATTTTKSATTPKLKRMVSRTCECASDTHASSCMANTEKMWKCLSTSRTRRAGRTTSRSRTKGC